jgi:hypothetical protein
MMWVLVILTIAGGTSSKQPSLAECAQSLRAVQTSKIREAYCMSARRDDRVYFIKGGKLARME